MPVKIFHRILVFSKHSYKQVRFWSPSHCIDSNFFLHRKEAEKKKDKYKAGLTIGLSGRDMFTFNPTMVGDEVSSISHDNARERLVQCYERLSCELPCKQRWGQG